MFLFSVSSLNQDGRLPPVLVATTIMQYLGTLVLFAASCINDVPSRLQKLTRTEVHTRARTRTKLTDAYTHHTHQ